MKNSLQLNMVFKHGLLLVILLYISSCARGPKGIYTDERTPLAPDYSIESNWAALPTKADNADKVPLGLSDNQDNAEADVFYVHPTMYYGKRSYTNWNASLDNQAVNEDVDNVTLLYQASCFNAAGRVYAPRYRQAHIRSYGNKDQASAKKAFDLAYTDVKAAFEYYLKHWNNERPFIIASHSQGTTHCQRLIKELIDNTPLQEKLIVAYLVGIPVDLDQYESISPCKNKGEINCIVGWRTYKSGHIPATLALEKGYNVLITNPLSWTSETALIERKYNKGAVLTDFNAKPIPGLVNAQIYENILWCNKPKFKWSWLMISKNYHRGDINLYYMNIRENAQHRVKQWKKHIQISH